MKYCVCCRDCNECLCHEEKNKIEVLRCECCKERICKECAKATDRKEEGLFKKYCTRCYDLTKNRKWHYKFSDFEGGNNNEYQ